jgi:hypothetical protein
MSRRRKQRDRLQRGDIQAAQGSSRKVVRQYRWGTVMAAAGAGILVGGLIVALLTDSKYGSAPMRAWLKHWQNRPHHRIPWRRWGNRMNRSQKNWRGWVAEQLK